MTTEAHLLFLPKTVLPTRTATDTTTATCAAYKPARPTSLQPKPLLESTHHRALKAALGILPKRDHAMCVPSANPIAYEFRVSVEATSNNSVTPQSRANIDLLHNGDILASRLDGLSLSFGMVPGGKLKIRKIGEMRVEHDVLLLESDSTIFQTSKTSIMPQPEFVLLRYFDDAAEGMDDERAWDSRDLHLYKPWQPPPQYFHDVLAVNALFGPLLRASSLPFYASQGRIAYFRDRLEGCETYFQRHRNAIRDNIVVVFRGGCLYADKVLRAQEAGAALVIVINTDESTMQMLPADGVPLSQYKIPSVNIGRSDGLRLLEAYHRAAVSDVVLTPYWLFKGALDVRPKAERTTLRYGNKPIVNIVRINKREYTRFAALDRWGINASARRRLRRSVRLQQGVSFNCLWKCPSSNGIDGEKVACCA